VRFDAPLPRAEVVRGRLSKRAVPIRRIQEGRHLLAAEEARAEFRRAGGLTKNEREREHLLARAAELD
jgi:predicted RNA polymerase sigma factor